MLMVSCGAGVGAGVGVGERLIWAGVLKEGLFPCGIYGYWAM